MLLIKVVMVEVKVEVAVVVVIEDDMEEATEEEEAEEAMVVGGESGHLYQSSRVTFPSVVLAEVLVMCELSRPQVVESVGDRSRLAGMSARPMELLL